MKISTLLYAILVGASAAAAVTVDQVQERLDNCNREIAATKDREKARVEKWQQCEREKTAVQGKLDNCNREIAATKDREKARVEKWQQCEKELEELKANPGPKGAAATKTVTTTCTKTATVAGKAQTVTVTVTATPDDDFSSYKRRARRH
ncbi:hypothetical protein EYR41_004243 [Orbilia oligospora]|uniref:Uncharacterized protein n=1 Tax=Orbilia oligospora TaxID=2813651 RepID=A0A8H2E7W1_ORBOL|nr:hypothetical protein EYR41_004243 [Orbilia oligospora]